MLTRIDIWLYYGYMAYEIDFADEASDDLDGYRAYDRIAILDLIEKHLRYEPMRASKSRIKMLRGLRHPQYRLRIGDIRIFYDVHESVVEVVAIVDKAQAIEWLERAGIKSESEE